MPKVSVIIPTYNRAKYLSEAIDSVLAQVYQDFEIIIVDDGSTDNTRNIVEKYVKNFPEKIRYFFQEKKGSSAARNNGIRNAKGEYIAFLDSDDKWLSEKLEKQMKLIKNEDVGFVYSNAYVENNGKMTSRIKPTSAVLDFYGLFCEGKSIVMSTVLIKKEYLKKVGMFDESLQVAVDHDLLARVLLDYKVKHLNEPLAIYREHLNNVSSDMERMNKNGIMICEKFLKEKKVPRRIVLKKLAYKYYMLGKLYYENKKYKEATKAIGSAIITFPLVGLNFVSEHKNIVSAITRIIKPYSVFLYVLIRGYLWEN